ncbi:hypothetical protein HK105_202852 [Polyrhizophydium stewartii]|uniref:Uncharacterized protein n=1 Tax=Polyrhizophydium stewartii TaxID=2732419 RepID=A0ABR4NDG1_9FUNG|nr:hypothetical protein HK105_003784 [Polyrhizophydium stewartii]
MPPHKNLVEILSDSFAPAVILPATGSGQGPAHKLFYSQLRAAVKQLQQQAPFAQLVPGTAVTFLIPNSLEFIAVFFTIVAQRAVANPLNPAYTVDEIVFYLKDVEPRVVVILRDAPNAATVREAARQVGVPVYEVSLELVAKYGPAGPDGAADGPAQPQLQRRLSRLPTATISATPVDAVLATRPLDGNADPLLSTAPPKAPAGTRSQPAYNPDDVALFLHTSGTTGRPKGVPLSHRNLLASINNIVATYHLQPSDASYLVMPLFHVHGLIGVLLSTLLSGGTVIVPPRFSVTRFWGDFVDLGATWYSAVPTIHQMLLLKADETYPGHSGALRFIRSCSASLAPATMLELERRFRAPVIEAYAMTEAAHQMTSNFLPRGMRKPGSVGRGRGVNVRILDENGKQLPLKGIGEVCVNGPNVFSGYQNNPKANAESFHFDGKQPWFRTGDLGFIDEHKFVVLVGRIKEQINRGGEKISPIEIDQALLTHPAVAEAVAFPVSSAVYGQEIEAAVVLDSSGGASVTEADLKAHISAKLAAFKIPRTIYIVDLLPKTATGKVQRRIVAEHFAKAIPQKAKI